MSSVTRNLSVTVYLHHHTSLCILMTYIEIYHSLISLHGVHFTFSNLTLGKCHHASSDASLGIIK